MALATETVESLLSSSGRRVRVDYTAQINFDGFVQVIDALGGITIDVPKHIVDYAYPTANYGTMQVEFQPGPQQMDGQTALIYARTRHADSDFDRSKRQQQVLRAIVAELQQRGWGGRVAAMPGLLESIGGGEGMPSPVTTTFPIDRPDVMMGLMLLASGLEPDAIGQISINPETVPMTEIGSNLLWDQAGVHQQAEKLFHPPNNISDE
jgi:LCP family protein required for cell wall assembly